MCGIVGVVSAHTNGFSSDEVQVFRDMLFLDTLRGWDSTGSFLVSNKGNVHIRKAAMHGPDFISSDGYNQLKTKAWSNGLIWVGHNRAATRGTVSDQNAHPFWVDDKIVLVQNGTYKGSHKHLKDTEVDTEALAHVIAEEDDIEKALQKINAAYALVWYNVTTKQLHMIRNDERPLWIADAVDSSCFFASEYETILYAASRAKVQLKGKPRLLDVGKLCTFKLTCDNSLWEYTERDVEYKFRGTTTSSAWDESDWGEYYKWRNRFNMGEPNENVRALACAYPASGSVATPQRHEFTPVAQLAKPLTEYSIYHYVKIGAFKGWKLSINPNNPQRDAYLKYMESKRQKTVGVEFVDYFPRNDSRDCKDWYIVGNLLEPDDDGNLTRGPLIYVILGNESEITAMEMCEGAHTVTVSGTPTIMLHYPEDNRTMPDYAILSSFCVNPVKLEVEPNADESATVH